MNTRHRKPLVASVALMATAALGLSACSSSTSSSSSPSKSSSTSTSSTGASSTLVKTAQSAIDQYSGMPTFQNPGPPVDAAKLKGTKILVVAHDQIADLLVSVWDGVQQASAAAGLSATLFNGNANVSTIEQGIQEGISQKVGAILLDGVAANQVPSSLQAAAAAHIPVIGLSVGLASEGAPSAGLEAEAAGSNVLMGELMADTAIVHNDGKVNAILETFDNPDSTGVEKGIKKVFATCSACKIVASATIEPGNWPTQVAPTTSSLVRANPTANVVLPTADTMGIFATTGINEAAAASRVKVISADGSAAGPLALVKTGTVFIADVGVSGEWVGWEGVDQALRLMSSMKPGNPVIPIRYLDTANLAGINVSDQSAIYGDSYQAGYKKLWGVP